MTRVPLAHVRANENAPGGGNGDANPGDRVRANEQAMLLRSGFPVSGFRSRGSGSWPAVWRIAVDRRSGARQQRGFTLIELLIVVAMIAILSGAFGSVVIYTMRAEAEERLRMTLRQEGLQVVRALVREAHLARVAVEAVGEVRADDGTLLLEMGRARERGPRRIGYRQRGSNLERLVWEDTKAAPTVQVLAGHVRVFQVKRSGGLVRVEMELALDRYAKRFVKRYSFATRVGGVFQGAEWSERGRTADRAGVEPMEVRL